jgi:hypothetical protein
MSVSLRRCRCCKPVALNVVFAGVSGGVTTVENRDKST